MNLFNKFILLHSSHLKQILLPYNGPGIVNTILYFSHLHYLSISSCAIFLFANLSSDWPSSDYGYALWQRPGKDQMFAKQITNTQVDFSSYIILPERKKEDVGIRILITSIRRKNDRVSSSSNYRNEDIWIHSSFLFPSSRWQIRSNRSSSF